jgi:hypothetical protein
MHSCNIIPKQKPKALWIIKYLPAATILKHRKSKSLTENSFFFIHMKLIRAKEIPNLQKHPWHAFSHKEKRDGDDWSWNKQWV